MWRQCAPRACSLLLLLVTAAFAARLDVPQRFRDIFAAHCRALNLTDEEIYSKVLLPTSDLLATQELSNLDQIDAAFYRHKPVDCQSAGNSVKLSPDVDVEGPLHAHNAAKGAPLTFIILNGLFGELIPAGAFDDANNPDSRFARLFASRLRLHPSWDYAWDNEKLQTIRLPLRDVVRASSVEAEDGRTLYQVAWILQHPGSMESMRHNNYSVPILIRRINKFLEVASSSVRDFMLVGYSRGAVDALDVASRSPSLGWGDRFKGVITLDGVNWGTALADCNLGAIVSKNPEYCLAAQQKIKVLEKAVKLVPSLTHFASNTALLAEALADYKLSEEMTPSIPEFEDTETLPVDIRATWSELVKNLIFETHDFKHPVLGYDDNIQRIKNLAYALYDALDILSTQSRLEWWSTHTIPEDKLYMSITATQQGPEVLPGPWLHADESIVRKGYYQMLMINGHLLNDGQVTTGRELLNGRLHCALNPRQKPYEPHWVGIFQASHWADGLPHVVPCKDGWTDPYPRIALLNSLATWAAMHV